MFCSRGSHMILAEVTQPKQFEYLGGIPNAFLGSNQPRLVNCPNRKPQKDG